MKKTLRVFSAPATAIAMLCISLLSFHFTTAQSKAGDYRSKASGNWTTPSNWERFNGTSWQPVTMAPNSTNGAISIRFPNTITYTSTAPVDQVVIMPGATLVVESSNFNLLNGPGADLKILGTLQWNHGWTGNCAQWEVFAGGRANMNFKGQGSSCGTWNIQPGGVMNFIDVDGYINGTTINNSGTINFNPNAPGKRLRANIDGVPFAGTIDNKPGGVININNHEFELGTTGANLKFINRGTLNINSNLRFRGKSGFDNRGKIAIAQNTTFYEHERIDLNAGSSITGSGKIELSGYWSTNVPFTYQAESEFGANQLILNNGKIGGSAEFKTNYQLVFNGEPVIEGLPGVSQEAKITLSGPNAGAILRAGSRIKMRNTKFSNEGFIWVETGANGSLTLANSSFSNAGTLTNYTSPTSVFTIKSDSGASSFINTGVVSVGNNATIEFADGSSTLELQSRGTLAGEGTIKVPADFFNSQQIIQPEELTITGTTNLLANNGKLIWYGRNNTDIEPHLFDRLHFSGNLSLKGALEFPGFNDNFPDGDYELINVTDGTVSGNFTSTVLPPKSFIEVRDTGVFLIRRECYVDWYRDNDGDGWGWTPSKISTCNPPPGYVRRGGDCNDENTAFNPGVTEVINGIDDNCNGLIDEKSSFHFRSTYARGSYLWSDSLAWEYNDGGTWKPAFRAPNSGDSSVLITGSAGVQVNTIETSPKLTIAAGSNLSISEGGDLELWETSNANYGNVVVGQNGTFRPKTNPQAQPLYNYGNFFWHGGKLYTSVLNYNNTSISMESEKHLYATIFNYKNFSADHTSFIAGSASAYLLNTGSAATAQFNELTIIGPAGRSLLRNENGATLTLYGINKLDGLTNNSLITGFGTTTLNSLTNTGTITLQYDFWKGEYLHAWIQVSSVASPAGVFDLNLGRSNSGVNRYSSAGNIDLATIRLHVTKVTDAGVQVDTLIRSINGAVTGDLALVDIPAGQQIRKGSNYVVIENAPSLRASSIAVKCRDIERAPFIPTVQRRSQVFRIQGLQAPADAVMILDANGREVFSERIYGNNKSLVKLVPGIHFYRVITHGKVYTGKIMVTD